MKATESITQVKKEIIEILDKHFNCSFYLETESQETLKYTSNKIFGTCYIGVRFDKKDKNYMVLFYGRETFSVSNTNLDYCCDVLLGRIQQELSIFKFKD